MSGSAHLSNAAIERRAAILALLSDGRARTVREIADATGESMRGVRGVLVSLYSSGQVERQWVERSAPGWRSWQYWRAVTG